MQTISEDRIISAHVARVAVKIESIHLLQFLPRSLFFPPRRLLFFFERAFSKTCTVRPSARAGPPVSSRRSGCVTLFMPRKVVRKILRPVS